jgi:hypothetical protein
MKHWINLYHDRVRDVVGDVNKISACCRMHSVRIPRQLVTLMPQRKFFMATGILLFDLELFIGESGYE